MTMKALLQALLAVHLSVAFAGCATMHGPSKAKKEVVKDEPDESEDAGVASINGQLRQFNASLSQKSFDEAASHLRKAQLAVQRATELTRSHPEFEDASEAVVAAEKRYETAVEQDRIARRNAAIDELIKRGNIALQKANELQKQFQDRVPTVQDVGGIRAVLQELADVRISGQQYGDDQVYVEHARDRDAKARQLAVREAVAQWQIDASQSLSTSIESARQAIVAAGKTGNPEEQTSHYRTAAQAFATCLSTIQSLESKAEDVEPRLVATPLGTLSITNTRKECTERSTRLRNEVDKLAWRGRITQALGSLAQAETKRKQAKSAAEVAAAVDATITALAACNTELEGGNKMPGYDGKAQFESPYGQVTAPQIAKNCARERDQLTRDRPMYIWRGSAETLREPFNAARKSADAAKASQKSAEKIEQWSTAKTNASLCAEQATKLDAQKEADKKYPIATADGSMTVGRLREECTSYTKTADEELKKARNAVELEQFMTTLKGDELVVAKANGIPQRIESVEGGRVFIYEKTQFGFDNQGKTFDFRAAWKQKVDAVVADIARFITPVRSAATAEAQLSATDAAINGMSQCQGALPNIDRRPGFDANAEFDTPLGKLYAVQITKACATEREKLQATITALRWKAQLEKVRDRAAQAQSEVGAAKNAPTAAQRVQLLSTAMGGLKECSDRADGLASSVGADAKLEIGSPFGQVNRKKLQSECASALTRAQKDLDEAIVAKKLEDFIATAKGDEKEVARREGIPARIESKGGGRIFVYTAKAAKGKKAEDKRIAFNAQGQRVAEAMLQ